jgi:hypothetical protein
MAGLKVLGYLLLEDHFQHGFHALSDSGFYVQLHIVLELVFRGQVSPSSLNPQLIRHYLCTQRTSSSFTLSKLAARIDTLLRALI